MSRFGIPMMLAGLGLIVYSDAAAWLGFLILGVGAVLHVGNR